MNEITHRRVATNGITLHVAECGPADGRPVVLVHGFPELWYSWRHQLPALAEAGYRVMAPDLRGYGDSDRPSGVDDYGIVPLAEDLLGLLDWAGYDDAIFVGHDWGAIIVWDLARLYPDRVAALCAMSVPASQSPMPPTQLFELLFADRFFYILYFQPVGPAEEELGEDPRRTLRRMLWSASGDAAGAGATLPVDRPRQGTGFLDVMSDPPDELPGWLRAEDLDFYVAKFTASGFFGPVSFYRNLDANWERTKAIPLSAISMPSAFIAGSRDPVLTMLPGGFRAMEQDLPNFRGVTLIDGAGHWNQQEKPDQTNAALLSFLGQLSD